MSVYPDADTLLAGPLGGWLQEQVAVREKAKQQSMQRIVTGGGAAAVILLFFWALFPFRLNSKHLSLPLPR